MDDVLLLDTLRAQISTTQGAEGAPILLGPSLGYHRVQGISPQLGIYSTPGWRVSNVDWCLSTDAGADNLSVYSHKTNWSISLNVE